MAENTKDQSSHPHASLVPIEATLKAAERHGGAGASVPCFIDLQGETIARLKSEVESLRKDAQRYLVLRDGNVETWSVTQWVDDNTKEVYFGGTSLDEALDAALAQQQGETNGN